MIARSSTCQIAVSVAAICCCLAASVDSHAAIIHFEGFESPAWSPGGSNWNNFGGATVQRIPSTLGTSGAASSSGTAHATLSPGTGPFTRFGGYSNTFGNGFTTSLDVFLDLTWNEGQGFDYSSAANRQNGDHLRDFIFHVGVENGNLIVNASNNTDAMFNDDKLLQENSGNYYTVANSGWYTFEHVFYDNAGDLAVDLNLRDAGGALLHSITRSDPSDDIATVVGGNRYGWFTYNNITGLEIDNTQLATADAVADVNVVPEPTSLLGFAGLLGLVGWRLRRKRRSR